MEKIFFFLIVHNEMLKIQGNR